MRHAVVWSLIAGLVTTVAPLQGQQVRADVIVHGGPVAGRVIVRDGYSTYRRPTPRRVVVVDRARIVLVEHVHTHRPAKVWARRGYRPVTLVFSNGRYYDRWVGHRYDAREVTVWERNGRFFVVDCDDRHPRHERHHDHDDGRHWDD